MTNTAKAIVSGLGGATATWAVTFIGAGGAQLLAGFSMTQAVNRVVTNDPATNEPMSITTSGKTRRVTVQMIASVSDVVAGNTRVNALKGLDLPAVQAKVTLSGCGAAVDGDYNFTGEGSGPELTPDGTAARMTLTLERYLDSALTAIQFATAVA